MTVLSPESLPHKMGRDRDEAVCIVCQSSLKLAKRRTGQMENPLLLPKSNQRGKENGSVCQIHQISSAGTATFEGRKEKVKIGGRFSIYFLASQKSSQKSF